MPRINATVEERHAEQLAAMKEEIGGDPSDAEATRRIFDRAQREIDVAQGARSERAKGEQALAKERARREQAVADAQADLQERIDELESDLEDKDNRMEDLRNQLSAANSRDEEHTELVNAVQREQTLAERKAQAGALTRAKWWLTGMPDE